MRTDGPFTRAIGTALLACASLLAAPLPAAELPSAKVILLGVDGLSPDLLDRFGTMGALPNLDALAREGGRWKLRSFWPLRTMQIWTSIATGKLPGQHGIWDHVKDSGFNPPCVRTADRRVVTSADRRSKALWTLLGEAGFKTLVVGWPTTWPAEQVPHGVVVAPKVLYGDDRRVTIKGAMWRHVDGLVQPATLLPAVRKLIVEPRDVTADEMQRFADVPPAGSPLYALERIQSYVRALRWSLARAGSVEAITLGLADTVQPDVVLAYFQCSDSLPHRFWIFQKPEEEIRKRLEQFGIPTDHVPELKQRFGQVIEGCYRDIDARVGRLLARLRGPDTLVLVVSDHGFGDGPANHPFRAEPYGGIHRSTGAMLAAGPGVEAADEDSGLPSVLDVAPTVLYALGLPVADDMRGHVMKTLFAPGRLEDQPVKRVPTYEPEAQFEVPHAGGYPEKPASFVW